MATKRFTHRISPTKSQKALESTLLDGENVKVDATGFDGNLANTDDTVQKIAQKLDDLTVASGGGSTSGGGGFSIETETVASYSLTTLTNGHTRSAVDVGSEKTGLVGDFLYVADLFSNFNPSYVTSTGAGYVEYSLIRTRGEVRSNVGWYNYNISFENQNQGRANPTIIFVIKDSLETDSYQLEVNLRLTNQTAQTMKGNPARNRISYITSGGSSSASEVISAVTNAVTSVDSLPSADDSEEGQVVLNKSDFRFYEYESISPGSSLSGLTAGRTPNFNLSNIGNNNKLTLKLTNRLNQELEYKEVTINREGNSWVGQTGTINFEAVSDRSNFSLGYRFFFADNTLFFGVTSNTLTGDRLTFQFIPSTNKWTKKPVADNLVISIGNADNLNTLISPAIYRRGASSFAGTNSPVPPPFTLEVETIEGTANVVAGLVRQKIKSDTDPFTYYVREKYGATGSVAVPNSIDTNWTEVNILNQSESPDTSKTIIFPVQEQNAGSNVPRYHILSMITNGTGPNLHWRLSLNNPTFEPLATLVWFPDDYGANTSNRRKIQATLNKAQLSAGKTITNILVGTGTDTPVKYPATYTDGTSTVSVISNGTLPSNLLSLVGGGNTTLRVGFEYNDGTYVWSHHTAGSDILKHFTKDQMATYLGVGSGGAISEATSKLLFFSKTFALSLPTDDTAVQFTLSTDNKKLSYSKTLVDVGIGGFNDIIGTNNNGGQYISHFIDTHMTLEGSRYTRADGSALAGTNIKVFLEFWSSSDGGVTYTKDTNAPERALNRYDFVPVNPYHFDLSFADLIISESGSQPIIGAEDEIYKDKHWQIRMITEITPDSDDHTFQDTTNNKSHTFRVDNNNPYFYEAQFKRNVTGEKGDTGTGVTEAQLTKLNNIEAGAEVNVHADWEQQSATSDAFIDHKPTVFHIVPTKPTVVNLGRSIYVKSTGLFYEGKSTAETQIATYRFQGLDDNGNKAITLAGLSGYTSLKLNIGASRREVEIDRLQASWNGQGGTATFIGIGGTRTLSLSYRFTATQIIFENNETAIRDTVTISGHTTEWSDLNLGGLTTAQKTKLAGISSGAEVNVQSDLSETDPSSDAFVKNKDAFTTNSATIESQNLGNYSIPIPLTTQTWSAYTNLGTAKTGLVGNYFVNLIYQATYNGTVGGSIRVWSEYDLVRVRGGVTSVVGDLSNYTRHTSETTRNIQRDLLFLIKGALATDSYQLRVRTQHFATTTSSTNTFTPMAGASSNEINYIPLVSQPPVTSGNFDPENVELNEADTSEETDVVVVSRKFDKTYPRESSQDVALGFTNAEFVDGDGTTMWVSSQGSSTLKAFNEADGRRDSTKDRDFSALAPRLSKTIRNIDGIRVLDDYIITIIQFTDLSYEIVTVVKNGNTRVSALEMSSAVLTSSGVTQPNGMIGYGDILQIIDLTGGAHLVGFEVADNTIERDSTQDWAASIFTPTGNTGLVGGWRNDKIMILPDGIDKKFYYWDIPSQTHVGTNDSGNLQQGAQAVPRDVHLTGRFLRNINQLTSTMYAYQIWKDTLVSINSPNFVTFLGTHNQADWGVNDNRSPAFINNKPRTITPAERIKLNGIDEGAEVNRTAAETVALFTGAHKIPVSHITGLTGGQVNEVIELSGNENINTLTVNVTKPTIYRFTGSVWSGVGIPADITGDFQVYAQGKQGVSNVSDTSRTQVIEALTGGRVIRKRSIYGSTNATSDSGGTLSTSQGSPTSFSAIAWTLISGAGAGGNDFINRETIQFSNYNLPVLAGGVGYGLAQDLASITGKTGKYKLEIGFNGVASTGSTPNWNRILVLLRVLKNGVQIHATSSLAINTSGHSTWAHITESMTLELDTLLAGDVIKVQAAVANSSESANLQTNVVRSSQGQNYVTLFKRTN